MSTATFNKLPDEPIVIMALSGSSSDLSESARDPMHLQSILNANPNPCL